MKNITNPTNDPNADERPFTPGLLEEFSREVEVFREEALMNTDDAGADIEAAQYFLLALAALETAQRHFQLAAYKQSQGIAAHQMGRDNKLANLIDQRDNDLADRIDQIGNPEAFTLDDLAGTVRL